MHYRLVSIATFLFALVSSAAMAEGVCDRPYIISHAIVSQTSHLPSPAHRCEDVTAAHLAEVARIHVTVSQKELEIGKRELAGLSNLKQLLISQARPLYLSRVRLESDALEVVPRLELLRLDGVISLTRAHLRHVPKLKTLDVGAIESLPADLLEAQDSLTELRLVARGSGYLDAAVLSPVASTLESLEIYAFHPEPAVFEETKKLAKLTHFETGDFLHATFPIDVTALKFDQEQAVPSPAKSYTSCSDARFSAVNASGDVRARHRELCERVGGAFHTPPISVSDCWESDDPSGIEPHVFEVTVTTKFTCRR